MADLTPYAITLGATDYPSKYAGLLAFLDSQLTSIQATAPNPAVANQVWLDTSTTPQTLRQRNAGNTAWIEIGRFDQTANTFNFSSLNTGQLAGMRNKIINGKMEIAQRGTSFAAVAFGAYTLDRFAYLGAATSAVVTFSQQSDVPSSNEFQNSLRVAVTTADTSIAAGDVAYVTQPVEGFNARDLIGRTFTLSFWVRSSKTGTHCVSFRNSAPDRTFIAEYTVSAANTWEYKSVTVSGGLITAGTWNWTNGVGLYVGWALAAGTTFQTTAGAWQTGTFLSTSAQVNCLDSNTNIFAITGVQLEVGSVATPFEHRPYGAELALCQRYYQSGTARSRYAATNGNDFGILEWLKTTMRITPGTITNGTITSNIGTTNFAVSASDQEKIVWVLTANITGTGNVSFSYTASAEL